MLHSRDRILTTHVGSLPRNEVLTDLLIRREAGEAIDRDTMGAEMDRAVRSIGRGAGCRRHRHRQRRRAAAGRLPDLYPGRMSGFGGESKRKVGKDFQEVPELIEMFLRRFPRRAKISNAPQAVGEVRYLDSKDIEAEIARFKACATAAGAPFAETFATAPSPGIVATTMMNAYYKSHEDYLMALAREMRPEYLAIHEAGLILQIDAPDLAMERTMTFQDMSETEFLGVCELHMAAINKGLEGIPRDRVRLHCCWGNWEGPHVHDIGLGADSAHSLPGARRCAHHRVRQPAPPARIRGAARQSPAQGLAADPRRHRHHHQLRRAPASGGAAHRGGGGGGRRPRAGDRLDRLRLRHLRGPRMGGGEHRLEEARSLARRRRHRLRPPVGWHLRRRKPGPGSARDRERPAQLAAKAA